MHCNFGDMLDRLLRDRFVAGIADSIVQQQLLAKSDLKIKEALEIAVASETSKKDSKVMRSGVVVHRIR